MYLWAQRTSSSTSLRALVSFLPNRKEIMPSIVPVIETTTAKSTQKIDDQPAKLAVKVVTTKAPISSRIEK